MIPDDGAVWLRSPPRPLRSGAGAPLQIAGEPGGPAVRGVTAASVGEGPVG